MRHCRAFSQRFATIARCLINIKVAIAGSDNLARTEVASASQKTSPMPLPHLFKRIRLELARSKEFPQGSANHGYEFVAPLDSKGHIDHHLWHQYREHREVRRFWRGADEEIGRLTHKPGGVEHARWVFDYDPDNGRRRSRLSLRDARLRTWRVCFNPWSCGCVPYLQGRVG